MLGIVLGGIITTFIGWQYIFFINIPIGIIAMAVGLTTSGIFIREPQAKLDLAGMGLLASALGASFFGLVNFAASGLSTL